MRQALCSALHVLIATALIWQHFWPPSTEREPSLLQVKQFALDTGEETNSKPGLQIFTLSYSTAPPCLSTVLYVSSNAQGNSGALVSGLLKRLSILSLPWPLTVTPWTQQERETWQGRDC